MTIFPISDIEIAFMVLQSGNFDSNKLVAIPQLDDKVKVRTQFSHFTILDNMRFTVLNSQIRLVRGYEVAGNRNLPNTA